MSEKAGANFIHKKDSSLQLSGPVVEAQEERERRGLETSQKPAIRLSNWFEVLERTHLARGASKERQAKHEQVLERIKASYHKLFVIKPEEIPESVFGLEVRLARERGEGNIPPYEEFKQAKSREIITAQESSLDKWVDYLTSEDADSAGYPMWARYWAFMAVIKMGLMEKHVKEDGTIEIKFGKRDEHTVAQFAELNPKALAQTIQAMQHQLEQEGLPKAERRIDNTSKVLNDQKFAQMLSEGSFAKIYGQFLAENPSITTERLKETRGEWVRYEHGSDATELYDSLQGHTLEWCTAGAVSTAQSQLDDGDFYVYYSLDANGQPTIPRIAIRKEHNQIAEIRGIEHDQHLDPYISEVLEGKLKNEQEFPNAKEYMQGAEDMKRVTSIERKMGARYNDLEAEFLGYDNPHAELSKEELEFIYEIDRKIVSLGYGEDPRIEQITSTRDIKSDLSYALDVPKDKISTTQEEALSGEIAYHYGDLDLNSLTFAEGLTLPDSIGGDLDLGSLTSAEGLTLPTSISGSLNLIRLTSAEGLTLPTSISGYLDLRGLTSAEGLTLPTSIGGSLNLIGLTSAEGLTLPTSIGGSLNLSGLTSAEGLTLPTSISGYLDLRGLTSAEGLTLPDSIGGDLDLGSLTSAEGLTLPTSIGGDLYLHSFTSAEGLQLPESIGGYLDLRGLTSAEGLTLPTSISGYLDLRGLTSAEGLTLPDSIGGSLNLSGLTSAEGLTLPDSIGGDLYLHSFTSAEGLQLPESIGGYLDLRGLTSAEGLTLPDSIGGSLYLGGLTSAERNQLRAQRPDFANEIYPED